MAKPLVAVVGRPNVGKSTFFNKVIGKRIAIVEDTPGVTRDRLYADTEWLGREFTIIDTGGIEPENNEPIFAQMKAQAEIAIDTADVILFFVDGKEGVTGTDMDIANLLRRTSKPVILVVNKVDNFAKRGDFYDFYSLGMGEPMPVCAVQMLGFGDLLDEVISCFPPADETEEEEEPVKIAVVGKPNAGKSSLVNRILNDERVIVSNIPGTTRDAIDTPFTEDGKKYIIIDTAGMRKKSKIEFDSIERYGIVRGLNAIRRADVVLLVLDAEAGITEQDTKIAGFIHEEGKACIIVVNKWDLIEKDNKTMDTFRKKISESLKFMDYAPFVFISALTGQRLPRVMEEVARVYENASRRVPTGLLNDIIGEATALNEPPMQGGRRLKLFYATQASVNPPAFVLFVNDEKLMHYGYQRYIENTLRKGFDFEGTPLKFILRNRGEKGGK